MPENKSNTGGLRPRLVLYIGQFVVGTDNVDLENNFANGSVGRILGWELHKRCVPAEVILHASNQKPILATHIVDGFLPSVFIEWRDKGFCSVKGLRPDVFCCDHKIALKKTLLLKYKGKL